MTLGKAAPPQLFSLNFLGLAQRWPGRTFTKFYSERHWLLQALGSLIAGARYSPRKDPLALSCFDSILKHAPSSGAEA